MKPITIKWPGGRTSDWPGLTLVPGVAVCHKPFPFAPPYCLVHEPTGRLIGQFDDAEQAAAALTRYPKIDWLTIASGDDLSDDQKAAIKAAVWEAGGEW